jgi:hypothetical protein
LNIEEELTNSGQNPFTGLGPELNGNGIGNHNRFGFGFVVIVVSRNHEIMGSNPANA